MDETIYAILKVLFNFALEVWFSIVGWNCLRGTENLFRAKLSLLKSNYTLSQQLHYDFLK